MVKALLVLALLGGLGWFGFQQLGLDKADVPTTPSVGYPTVDAGDGVGGVGEKTGGILGN